MTPNKSQEPTAVGAFSCVIAVHAASRRWLSFLRTEKETRKCDPFDAVFAPHSTALDWAVFGCLIAGAVGIIKAFGMDSPLGVLLCLLGSVAAFGLVIYVHFRKH
jgi:hypothetical protein